MYEPFDESYFNWLCAKIRKRQTHRDLYLGLLRILHGTEFIWLVSGDDNRVADGLELRVYFEMETGVPVSDDAEHLGCSILEMLVAFSREASFQTDDPPSHWFWVFIDNLGLSEYRGSNPEHEDDICDVLNRFVWREYGFNGRGGILPIRWPKEDQKEREIWYQFSDYVSEQGLF